jgi:hypothetical protein
MFHVLSGDLFSMASNTIDSFDAFDILASIDSTLSARLFLALTCATSFGMALAFEIDATFRTNCEAVMWKITTITTHDFTLEEVLIMVAMNLLASTGTTAKRYRLASPK